MLTIGIEGRRARIVVALLVTWALVASIGLGWSLTIQQQQEQQREHSNHFTVGVLIAEMGGALETASSAGQSFLLHHSLDDGWNGTVWMDDATGYVHALGWITDGNTVLYGLNLTGLDCVAQRYASIVVWAAANSSLLNGPNRYTAYFSSVVNLTSSSGNELVNIASATGADYSQVLDRLNSPVADSIRADLHALYIAGADIWSFSCPRI
jgi:hypothetical protein